MMFMVVDVVKRRFDVLARFLHQELPVCEPSARHPGSLCLDRVDFDGVLIPLVTEYDRLETFSRFWAL